MNGIGSSRCSRGRMFISGGSSERGTPRKPRRAARK